MSKGGKKSATSSVDDQVAKWLRKAPPIQGLRRPGLRMKVAAMLQRIDTTGSDDLDSLAGTVADIDELMAQLGGQPYVDWIEKVPLDDGVQVMVLLELFRKAAPELGKGWTSLN